MSIFALVAKVKDGEPCVLARYAPVDGTMEEVCLPLCRELDPAIVQQSIQIKAEDGSDYLIHVILQRSQMSQQIILFVCMATQGTPAGPLYAKLRRVKASFLERYGSRAGELAPSECVSFSTDLAAIMDNNQNHQQQQQQQHPPQQQIRAAAARATPPLPTPKSSIRQDVTSAVSKPFNTHRKRLDEAVAGQNLKNSLIIGVAIIFMLYWVGVSGCGGPTFCRCLNCAVAGSVPSKSPMKVTPNNLSSTSSSVVKLAGASAGSGGSANNVVAASASGGGGGVSHDSAVKHSDSVASSAASAVVVHDSAGQDVLIDKHPSAMVGSASGSGGGGLAKELTDLATNKDVHSSASSAVAPPPPPHAVSSSAPPTQQQQQQQASSSSSQPPPPPPQEASSSSSSTSSPPPPPIQKKPEVSPPNVPVDIDGKLREEIDDVKGQPVLVYGDVKSDALARGLEVLAREGTSDM